MDFEIPKKSGEMRKISAPCFSLKVLQRWVLEEILYKTKVSPYSYGFMKKKKVNNMEESGENGVKDRSKPPIVDVAMKHVKNLFILKMDLKDFYPSIDRDRVFSQFIKIGYGSNASSLLTEICTHDAVLPQGAVTSPCLASIICYSMDMRIAGYCNKRGIIYTRYADDMIFSSDDRGVIKGIHKVISKIVLDEGFSINDEKTRFLSPKGRKEVLGLVLNDGKKPLAARELKKKIRAMIHYQIVSGDYTEYEKVLGYIAYVESVEEGYREKVKKYIKGFLDDRIVLFSDAVNAFNAHKYFSDIEHMKELSSDEFFEKNDSMYRRIDPNVLEDIINDMYYERHEFIELHR